MCCRSEREPFSGVRALWLSSPHSVVSQAYVSGYMALCPWPRPTQANSLPSGLGQCGHENKPFLFLIPSQTDSPPEGGPTRRESPVGWWGPEAQGWCRRSGSKGIPHWERLHSGLHRVRQGRGRTVSVMGPWPWGAGLEEVWPWRGTSPPATTLEAKPGSSASELRVVQSHRWSSSQGPCSPQNPAPSFS